MCQNKNEQPTSKPEAGNPTQQDGTDRCGLTELPFGTGCTAAPPFWEDCNATGRCEAHLANHVDAYAHQLDGLSKRTFSGPPNDSSPTSTNASQAQPNAPWREPNFPLTPTVPQIWRPGQPSWQPGFQPEKVADCDRGHGNGAAVRVRGYEVIFCSA